MVPPPLRLAGIVVGGVIAVNFVSSFALGVYRVAAEAKLKSIALACEVCRGKGFYICRLCKGYAAIKWSPLYDPFYISPCLCPTCDGNRVQRCLNCIGKGYCFITAISWSKLKCPTPNCRRKR